jgi:pyrimidine deaminase RibD-like protein
MKSSDFQIHNRTKLDKILVELCQMVINGQEKDNEYYGMVAAAVLDPKNRIVKSVNHVVSDGKHKHAERVAIDEYKSKYGDIPEGSIIITTLSPCSEQMDERYGEDCTDLINDTVVRKVYCGYEDPSQDDSENYQHKKFHVEITKNKKIVELCKKFADTFLNNN